MENILYNEEFTDVICELADEQSINVVGNFGMISGLVDELLCDYGYVIGSIVMPNPDLFDCDDVFTLTLEDEVLFVNHSKYVDFYKGDIVFVFEDMPSKIISDNKDAVMIEVDYCNHDCEHCLEHEEDDGYITEYSHGEDGEMHGFTRSKTVDGNYYSESFYSTDPKIVQFQLAKKNF